MEDVIIIGAGLSGLSVAYYLKKQNINCKVLEAQNRLGGRIETIYGLNNTPMEMGATWFGNQHQNLIQFLNEIGITYFKQHDEGIALFETMSFEAPQQYYVPVAEAPVYRVKGGTYSIINALNHYVGTENILLQQTVINVVNNTNHIVVICNNGIEYKCKKLIIAIPPQLLINSLRFTPTLPTALTQVMMQVQTWMSGSIKFSIEYKSPFWRTKGFSGSVYSQSGIAPEIYDHTNFEENKFAIKGFLNYLAVKYTYLERQQKVVAQLTKYWGEECNDFISYHDKIWDDKFVRSENEQFLPAHYNNGNELLNNSYMNNKLFFTASETSKLFSGYMDGAINSAKKTVKAMQNLV